jgi:hypothetical protein
MARHTYTCLPGLLPKHGKKGEKERVEMGGEELGKKGVRREEGKEMWS